MRQAYAAEVEAEQQSYLVRVFFWLCAGLVVSAGTAVAGVRTAESVAFLGSGGTRALVVIVAPLAGLLLLTTLRETGSVRIAFGLYFLFCALNGWGLGALLLVNRTVSIAVAFGVGAGMFGGMAVFGHTTKRDLSGWESLVFMGLWGLTVASSFNIALDSFARFWTASVLGVSVFLGLTAYDMQKIKAANVLGDAGTDADRKEPIMGAIAFYVDLVNLPVTIAVILGKRK